VAGADNGGTTHSGRIGAAGATTSPYVATRWQRGGHRRKRKDRALSG
jgi:hypothetical protein